MGANTRIMSFKEQMEVTTPAELVNHFIQENPGQEENWICANCNRWSSDDRGRRRFRDSLPLRCRNGRKEMKEDLKLGDRNVLVYDALVKIFHGVRALNANGSNSDGLDLSICNSCSSRLRRLYEEFITFTHLSFRSGSFLSSFLIGRATVEKVVQEDRVPGRRKGCLDNIAKVTDDDALKDSDSDRCFLDFERIDGDRNRESWTELSETNVKTPELEKRRKIKKCPVCSKEYSNSLSFEKHLRLHRRKKRMVRGLIRVGRSRKDVTSETEEASKDMGTDLTFPPFYLTDENEKPRNNCLEVQDEHLHTKLGKNLSECATCGKKFMSLGHLLQHKKTHEKKRNECSHCNKTFRYPSELRNHLLMHGIPIGCDLIADVNGITTVLERKVGDETKVHENTADCERHSEALFKDSSINKRARGRPKHSGGMKKKKVSGPVVCVVCNREFRHSSFLDQHMQVHNKRFVCHECPFESPDAKGLREHKAQHRRESRANLEPMNCKYSCGKFYYDESRLLRHQETHELPPPTHKCTRCTRSFRKKEKLTKHMTSMHTTETHYDCPSCDKKYPRKDKLNRHISRKHGEAVECEHCGKVMIKAALQAHQVIHFFEKPRELACDVCGRKYQNVKYLKTHIKFMHTKRDAHACTFPNCSKTFGRLSCLMKHLVVHEEVGSFLCVHCGKNFKRERSLKQHEQKQHLGEEFYENVCPVCNKKFHRNDLLKAHQVRENHFENLEPPSPCMLKTNDNQTHLEHIETLPPQVILQSVNTSTLDERFNIFGQIAGEIQGHESFTTLNLVPPIMTTLPSMERQAEHVLQETGLQHSEFMYSSMSMNLMNY